jgi:hypothetical protein
MGRPVIDPVLRGKELQRSTPPKRMVTILEKFQREELVTELLGQCASEYMIAKKCRERFGMSTTATRTVIHRIKDTWSKDGGIAARLMAKKAAEQRALSKLRELREEPEKIKKTLIENARKRWEATPPKKGAKKVPFDLEKALSLHEEIAEIRANNAEILQWEKFLSDLQGTKAPQEVNLNLNVNETIIHVLGSLTGEQLSGMLDEAKENQRLAELARNTFVTTAEVA